MAPTTPPAEDTNAAAFEQIYTQLPDALTTVEGGYQVELAISSLLGGIYPMAAPDRQFGVRNFAELFTDHMAGKRSQKACAVLAGLGAVAPEPAGRRAREALRALARQQTPMPWWATIAGKVRCVETLVGLDVFGDTAQYYALFEYQSQAGGPDHVVVVTVDRNIGVIEEAGVIAPGRPVLAGLRAADVTAVGLAAIDPAVLRAEVYEAIERTDAMPQPPGAQAYLDQWAFLLARIRALPEGGRSGRPEPLTEVARDELVQTFMTDTGDDLARARNVDRAVVARGARLAIDYAVDVNSGDPLRWSPVAAERFLIHWIPDQPDVPADVASWLPEVLTAFTDFAWTYQDAPPANAQATRTAIEMMSRAYSDKMLGGGAAESMEDVLKRMVAAGVDPSDDAAVRAWLERYVDQPGDGGQRG